MEFRDGPSLAKGTISLPDLGWRCPFPSPRYGMPSVQATFPSFCCPSTFQCWAGWRRDVHLGAPPAHLKPGHPLPAPYTQHKPRASPLPTLRSLPMLCLPSPPPPFGDHVFRRAEVSRGGARLGTQERGRGRGEGQRRSVTSCRCPLRRGPRRGGRGAWRVLFYLLFPDFFCI